MKPRPSQNDAKPLTFDELARKLGPVESFDPAIFESGGGADQDTCDLFVALALAHNDFRDIHAGLAILADMAPGDPETARKGLHSGMSIALVRAMFGVIDEVLNLIRKSQPAITTEAFRTVYRKLPKTHRESWDDLSDTALAKKTPGTKVRSIADVRNAVSFHYNRESLGVCFRRVFCKSDSRPPMVSRGLSLVSTRYYFADAAAEEASVGVSAAIAYAEDPLIDQIRLTLGRLVEGFVEHRGGAWRAVTAAPSPPAT